MKLEMADAQAAVERVTASVDRFIAEDGYDERQAIRAAAMVHGVGQHVVGRLYSEQKKADGRS